MLNGARLRVKKQGGIMGSETPADRLRQLHQDRLAHARLLQNGAFDRARAVEAIRTNPQQPAIASAKLFNGAMLQVDLKEVTSKVLFTFGAFEEHLTAFFCSYLKEGMMFVDVGAHFGYFSVVAASLVGKTGRVVAFEPIPETAQRLKLNAQRFPDIIEVRQLAAWNKGAQITMNMLDAEHSAFNSVATPRLMPHMRVKSRKLKVKAARLDGIFPEGERQPSVVKIDAESAEMQVLQGMTRILETTRPVVTVEVGDYKHLMESGVPDSTAVLQFLANMDYRLFDSDYGSLKPHELRETGAYSYDNIIGVPREHPLADASAEPDKSAASSGSIEAQAAPRA